MPDEPKPDTPKSLLDFFSDPVYQAVWQEAARREQAEMAAARAARVYPQHYQAAALGKVVRVGGDGECELGEWRDGAFVATSRRAPVVVRLDETCGACPEQYDAYIGAQQVGYLRLRHGAFYASYPEHGGRQVYTAMPQGDGRFEPEERDHHLDAARAALFEAWLGDWGEASPEAIAAEVVRQHAALEAEAAERRERLEAWKRKHQQESP